MGNNKKKYPDTATFSQVDFIANNEMPAMPEQPRLSSEDYRDYMDPRNRYFYKHIRYKKIFKALLIGFAVSYYFFSVCHDQYVPIRDTVRNGIFTSDVLMDALQDFDAINLIFGPFYEFGHERFWIDCLIPILLFALFCVMIQLFSEWKAYIRDRQSQKREAVKHVDYIKQNNTNRSREYAEKLEQYRFDTGE